MIPALERQLLEAWAALDAGPPPRRIHVAKLSHGDYPPPTAPLLFFFYADEAAEPVAVAKAARGPEGDAIVAGEITALRALTDLLPPERRADVPRILVARTVNGRASVLLQALAGEVELHHTWEIGAAARRTARMTAGLDWMHAVGRGSGTSAAGAVSRTIAGRDWLGVPPETAVARLARLGCDLSLLDRSRERLAALWDWSSPAGVVHGDYFPGNLLFDRDDRVRVLDWAFFAAYGPRCMDPITYELSFLAARSAAGRAIDPGFVRAVHGLPAFVAERRRWSALGVDLGIDGQARLATLLALALRDGASDASRGPIGRTWARLFGWHLEQTG